MELIGFGQHENSPSRICRKREYLVLQVQEAWRSGVQGGCIAKQSAKKTDNSRAGEAFAASVDIHHPTFSPRTMDARSVRFVYRM